MVYLLTKIKKKNSNDNDYQLSYYERFSYKLQSFSKIYFTKIGDHLMIQKSYIITLIIYPPTLVKQVYAILWYAILS